VADDDMTRINRTGAVSSTLVTGEMLSLLSACFQKPHAKNACKEGGWLAG
jgi:hypothetical protein